MEDYSRPHPAEGLYISFYDELLASAIAKEELKFGYTITYADIDVPLQVVARFTDCVLIQDKVRWMDGYMAVVKSPDEKLIVLTEVSQ